MASVGDARAASVDGGAQRAGNDDGGKEAAIEKATSIAAGWAAYSCFCWRIAAPHALSQNPPRLREAVLRGCHLTCYFIWPTYQPNHVLNT